ncbi:hypothetical protein GGS26DRAFT_296578 [Hypomontagnella submonticulosa]|nr:hypothetical protein GGS26DRAFT_296578 [Hypomontagnella submonticulosa]
MPLPLPRLNSNSSRLLRRLLHQPLPLPQPAIYLYWREIDLDEAQKAACDFFGDNPEDAAIALHRILGQKNVGFGTSGGYIVSVIQCVRSTKDIYCQRIS